MRHWLLLGLIVAAGIATRSQAAQLPPRSVETLVARYANGDHAAAREVNGETITADQFARALDGWISAGDVPIQRRVTVAVSFALDAVWAATRSYRHEHMVADDPDRGGGVKDLPLSANHSQGRVAEWAVKRLSDSGAVEAGERTLWLAAIGIAQEGRAWRRLQGEILPLAHRRLPDEPRVRLADVVARTNIELGHLRFVPGTIRRNDILRDEPYPPSSKLFQEAVRGFEALLSNPELAGEAHLRIGYLQLRHRRWTDAIEHLEAGRTTAREPFLEAAANYLAGWIHEQLKQPEEAVAAYRRAVALTPDMRNLSMRLAALLFLQNERGEAYALLEAAQKAQPAPVDLLVALDIGDGRFVPEWLNEIHGALR